jgi:hypothetical protein
VVGRLFVAVCASSIASHAVGTDLLRTPQESEWIPKAPRNHILRETAEKSGWWTLLEEMNANNMEANE